MPNYGPLSPREIEAATDLGFEVVNNVGYYYVMSTHDPHNREWPLPLDFEPEFWKWLNEFRSNNE